MHIIYSNAKKTQKLKELTR